MTLELDTREATLRQRVHDVYRAFGNYPLARHIARDPCFPGACDDRPLRAVSLEQLPPSAFERYQWKAVSTWGSVDDLKHFLPRLLEIIAAMRLDEATREIDPWMIFGKMRYSQWGRWRKGERKVLDEYFDALWSVLLAQPLAAHDTPSYAISLMEWLNNFAYAHDHLGRFLDQWEAEASHPVTGELAAAHLAHTITSAGQHLPGPWVWDASRRPQESEVTAWLASDRVIGLLEKAYFRWSEGPYAAVLSDGHYWLGWWRRERAGGE